MLPAELPRQAENDQIKDFKNKLANSELEKSCLQNEIARRRQNLLKMTTESVAPVALRENGTTDVGNAIDAMLKASGRQLEFVMRRAQDLEARWKDIGVRKRKDAAVSDGISHLKTCASTLKNKRHQLEEEMRTLQMLSKCSDRKVSPDGHAENGDKPKDPKEKGEVEKLREELEYMRKRIDDAQDDLASERRERREAQENSQREFDILRRDHEAEMRRMQNEAEINLAKLKDDTLKDIEYEADLRRRTNRLTESPQTSTNELEGLLVAHKQELQKMENESAHMQSTISRLQSTLREAENVDRADRDVLLSRVEHLQGLLDAEKAQRQEEVSGLYALLQAQKKSSNKDLGPCTHEMSRNDDLRMATSDTLASKAYGLIVVRGPDWKWGDQDGGMGSKGITTDSGVDDGWIEVAWENGNTQTYRIGAEGRFDLSISRDVEAVEREKSELLKELERLRGNEKALIAANETIFELRTQIEQDLKSMEDESSSSFIVDDSGALFAKKKFEDLGEELAAVEGPTLAIAAMRSAKQKLEEDLRMSYQRKIIAEDRVKELTGSASKEATSEWHVQVTPPGEEASDLVSPVDQSRLIPRSRSVSPMDRALSTSPKKNRLAVVPPLALPGNTSGSHSTRTSSGVVSPMRPPQFIPVSPQPGQSPLWGTPSQSYSVSPAAAYSPNAPFPPAGLTPAVVLHGPPVNAFSAAPLPHVVELNVQNARPLNNRYARGVVRQSSDPIIGKTTVRADGLSPASQSSRFRTPGSWSQGVAGSYRAPAMEEPETHMGRALSAPRLGARMLTPMSAPPAMAPPREMVPDMVAPWIEPNYLRATKTPPYPNYPAKPLQFKRMSVDEFEGTQAPQWQPQVADEIYEHSFVNRRPRADLHDQGKLHK